MSKLKTYKFSKLYEMSSGISSKPEQAGHGFPFLSFSTVFNNQFIPEFFPDLMDTSEKERNTYSVKEGDIFLTRTSETLDELGMSSVATNEIPNATYSGFLKRLRPLQTDISYHRFMAFYLRSKLFRKTMNNNAIMTLRASLNEQIFSYLDLLLPEFKEQKKIGDYLYLLNQKIELNNKINIELEDMAKLIYDYWFVQFDFPNANGKPYKSSGGKMVYSEKLRREIPEGFGVGVFDEYAKVKPGFAFKSSWWQSSGLSVVKIKDIQENNTLNQKEFSYVSKDKIDIAGKFASKANDVVIAMTGATIGKFAIIPKTDSPLLINQRVGLYDLGNDPILKLPFLINSMKQEFFRKMIFQLAGGAAQPNISGEQLGSLPLIMPPSNLVDKYNTLMQSNYKKYSNNEAESQHLIRLRDWLLPMLMNGQVTVK